MEDRIFVIGGWYPHNHLPEANTCKEDLSDSELTEVNNEYRYYQEYVQIYQPASNTWSQGPNLIQRRRKHGCALVTLNGRKVRSEVYTGSTDSQQFLTLKGIMVVGGYNSRDNSLSTVEYLELGSDLSALRWRQLSSMRTAKMGSPLVVDGR